MKSKIQPCIMPPYDVTKSSSLWIGFVKEKIQELLDLTTSTKWLSCVMCCITNVKQLSTMAIGLPAPIIFQNMMQANQRS